MPIYMDRHDVPGATAVDVARAHQEDLHIQDQYECKAITYWFDEAHGAAFCLVEAPNKEAVMAMHENAHGLVPHQIIEVQSSVVESFLGRIVDPESANSRENDEIVISESALRAIMCIGLHCTYPGQHTSDISTIHERKIRSAILDAFKHFAARPVEIASSLNIATFASVSSAVQCAKEIQHQTEQFSPTPEHRAPCVRMSLSTGIPVDGRNELFGKTLQEARRLCSFARGGQLLLAPSAMQIYRDTAEGELKTGNIRAVNPTDFFFLNNLMSVIEETWNDPDIQLDDIRDRIGISKSQLYRKISSLSGYSPIGFLREYRLQQSRECIEKQSGTVTEIAYECGFGSLSYFSKCFRKRFGISPSEFSSTTG
ncbi:MAG: hypothetical protein CL946_04485 [Ectothiorhodospiraceae bacterium]|nr:hypothetical protein [Ectothiorhodospiraceae bacterium]